MAVESQVLAYSQKRLATLPQNLKRHFITNAFFKLCHIQNPFYFNLRQWLVD